MSRSQETTATNNAESQNQGYYNEAQNSYSNAQQDVGNYENQLASYAAANPYTQGGQFQTAENQQLSNTADASAQAAGQTLQSQALRTGQNTNADVAATENMQQTNERNLAGQEAGATQQRISSEAGYNQGVLNATAVPEQMEQGIASSEAGQGNAALGSEVNAAKTPSWMDEFGNAVAAGLGKGTGSCWIAAELYGGWYEPRTVLVRAWLNTEFKETIFGRAVMALYVRFGKRTAGAIHKYPVLKRVFLPIFDLALAKARGGK